MNMKNFFLTIGVVLLSGGCMLMPKYKRPDAPVPANLPSAGVTAEGQSQSEIPQAADLKWQEFFSDPKLRQVITIALKENRDLRIAALNVEHARALYGVQRAELFPSANVAGGKSRQRISSDFKLPGQPRTTEQFNVNFGITAWEIDFFGRIRSLKEQALQEYLATEEARRSAQISLVSEVARAYLALAADRGNLHLAQSTLKTQENIYKLVQHQFEEGLATELDLYRVKTQVDTAREEVARYTQLVKQDRNALNLLAGSVVPEELLPSKLESVNLPKNIAQELPSEVLLRRPDIMAAEHQLKGAYAFIGAARAAFFPRISLTTVIGTASDELSGLFDSGNGTWNFTPQVVMPIFDTRTWAAYRVSKSVRKIAVAQYEKAIQTAFREVADTIAVLSTVDQQVAAQQAVVESAQKIYELSSQRYKQGLDSYLSVLDAQRSLFAAQQKLTVLKLSRHASQVQLYAVLGGGGNSDTPETSG